MLTILIVDDEKLERNGIKFLLKREQEEFRILEAANGKDALGVLMREPVDILFSDVKMPYMSGLELAGHARELYPGLEIVIFSGYNDFSYAKEALRYGVVDYVLKPVDPEEFHRTLERVRGHIDDRKKEEARQNRQEDYLKKYFLQEWLYTESGRSRENLGALTEDPGDIFNRCTRMILAGSANAFFETDEEHFIGSLKERIQREFYYINLNSNESLFLFAEKYTDYAQVAESLYQFFARQYDSECYFAVSRGVQGWQDFPAEFRELESLMSGQFYQPAKHVAVNGEKDDPAAHVTEPDSELTEQISRDIRYKDAVRLRQDFRKLEKKYRHEKKFSEMYVKFVFSGIVKEIYEQFPELGEKPLARKVERIYRCRQIGDILDIVDDAVRVVGIAHKHLVGYGLLGYFLARNREVTVLGIHLVERERQVQVVAFLFQESRPARRARFDGQGAYHVVLVFQLAQALSRVDESEVKFAFCVRYRPRHRISVGFGAHQRDVVQ